MTSRKIRVLIVDDSAIVRKVLSETLAAEPDIEVVGTAPDPFIARDKILSLEPDLITLDIEMPRMDGLTFLKKIMKHRPMPVIIISSLAKPSCQTAIEALHSGAVEVLAKPGGPYTVGELKFLLPHKIRAAAAARRLPAAIPTAPPPPPVERIVPAASADHSRTLIAIGASTGGTQAIEVVLRQMPPGAPPIVIVQHIPPVFSRAFADRLNTVCAIEVKEAEDGDQAIPGRALVAPGNLHMVLRRRAGGYFVNIKDGPRVCYQRPAVDVLFSSVAEAAGANTVAALLTGMGKDGAEGMLRLKRAGAHTIAQDEATCVVYGMPREAVLIGAADQVLPIDRIAHALLSHRVLEPV